MIGWIFRPVDLSLMQPGLINLKVNSAPIRHTYRTGGHTYAVYKKLKYEKEGAVASSFLY